jgi:parallel beta-helix repeat protein
VITISPLNPENFQIRVDIPSAIAKSDYPSIRFLENETSGLLPYWIERNEGSYLSVAWVRRLENSDNTIYMYYGKVSATSAENGDNTFLFFDDFSGSAVDTNKWGTAESNVSVSSNVLHLWANGKIEHGESQGLTTEEENTRRVIETRVKNATTERGGLLLTGPGWDHNETACIFQKGGGEYRFFANNFPSTTDGGYISEQNHPGDVYYVLSVDLYGDSKDKVKDHFYWGNDNASYRNLVEESQELTHDWAYPGDRVDKYSLRAWDDSSSYYFDWFIVRKYASPAPVATVAGSATHGPIFIKYDYNFTLANGVTSGSGTVGDPYIIENYIINSSAAFGIDIRNTTAYFIIRNCVIENGITSPGAGYMGIRLSTVVNGRVENCVSRNNNYGIALYYESENNVITNNTFENSYWYGIRLENSHNNLISNNLIKNFSSSYWGIATWKDKNNILDNNTIENVGGGIYLYDTENLKMRNNTVSCRGRKLGIEGDTLSHFIHDIDNSNLLNGRPPLYLIGHSNEVIDPSIEISYLGLVNCDNILVENRVFARRTDTQNINGILIANTQNSRVENCAFENNTYGIYLWGSDNNILANNTLENNTSRGIFILYSSDNNIIENNTILKNPLSTGAGIDFYYNPVVHYDWSFGSGNIIRNNNITSNSMGISNLKAENNYIYHNNFENNTTQAYDNGSNYWDDGYPSGGNYWSDYTGVDNYRGENQDIPGSDGIGDTPYIIPISTNQDRYPLMGPWTTPVYSVDVSISPSLKYGWIGDNLAYDVVVTNTGNRPDNYRLSLTDTLPWLAGWDAPSEVVTTVYAATDNYFKDVQDVYIRENQPTVNFGGRYNMYIGHENTGGTPAGTQENIYTKWNLSSLPAGAIIDNAYVWHMGRYGPSNPAPATTYPDNMWVEIYSVSDDTWNENVLTWSTGGPAMGSLLDNVHWIASVWAGQYKWFSLNVTSFVTSEFAGDQVASFGMRTNGVGDNGLTWQSYFNSGWMYQKDNYLGTGYNYNAPWMQVSYHLTTTYENSVSLGPGENWTGTVWVVLNGIGTDNKTVTATSMTDNMVTANATAQANSNVCGVEVTIENALLEGYPSQVLAYTIKVQNTGNLTDNFLLSNIPDGWPDIVLMDNVLTNVAPGDSAYTTVLVHVPDGAEPSTYKEITIVAESQNCGATGQDTALAHVLETPFPVTGTASIRRATGTAPFVWGIRKVKVTTNLVVTIGDNLRLKFLAYDNVTVESEAVIWSRTAPGAQIVNLTNLIVPHDIALLVNVHRVKLVLTNSAGTVIVDNMAWYKVVQDDWGARVNWIVLNWASHSSSQQDELGSEIGQIVLGWSGVPTTIDQQDFSA